MPSAPRVIPHGGRLGTEPAGAGRRLRVPLRAFRRAPKLADRAYVRFRQLRTIRRGARRSSKSDDVRAATMYQASEVERRCSGPSWISARIQADYRKDLEGPSWHPVSWLRRADRSSISSFHLADSAGKLSISKYSVSVLSLMS